MKKLAFLSAVLLAASMVGCDNRIPLEEEQYPRSVYLVGAGEVMINRDLNIGYDVDTIYASVAVSGSLSTPSDVLATVVESPESVDAYNKKELGSDDIHYRNPGVGVYSFPQENVVVKKGEVYGTYPILIDPSTLHIDSLYMIALKLESVSQFAKSEEDTVVKIRLSLMNKYSGLYYMDGVIKPLDNLKDSLIYKTNRNAQAVIDGNTVRVYHQKNEWSKGATDYRPGYCFNITVNEDNSLTLKPWDKFDLIEGGGMYYEDMEVYDLWYKFRDEGREWITRGFLYKDRQGDDELREITDWIEEHRVYDN